MGALPSFCLTFVIFLWGSYVRFFSHSPRAAVFFPEILRHAIEGYERVPAIVCGVSLLFCLCSMQFCNFSFRSLLSLV